MLDRVPTDRGPRARRTAAAVALLLGLAAAPVQAGGAMDIHEIILVSANIRDNGSLIANGYSLEVIVFGDGISSVSVTTPQGKTIPLKADGGDFFLEAEGFADLAAIANDPAIGFGDFTLNFVGTGGEQDSAVVAYDPGTTDPVSGYPVPDFPTNGQTGVPERPAFRWSCSNTDCGGFGWSVGVSDSLGDIDESLLPLGIRDWPSPLLQPNQFHLLYVDSIEILGGAFQQLATGQGGDPFTFVPVFVAGNEIQFTTGAAGGPPARDAVFDFRSSGVWRYQNGASWSFLTGIDPQRFLVADVDGNATDDVVFDFGSSGVWIYLNGASWSFLTGLDPDLMAAGSFDSGLGEEIAFHFPGIGVYTYSTTAGWRFLTGIQANRMLAASIDLDPRSDLVVQLGSTLWVHYNGTTWRSLFVNATPHCAGDLDDSDRDELIVQFANGCVYGLYDSRRWRLLTCMPAIDFCETGELDGFDGEELMLVTGNKITRLSNDATWDSIFGNSIRTLAAGDFRADATPDLVVGFAPSGGTYLWVNDQWSLFSGLSPDQIGLGRFVP